MNKMISKAIAVISAAAFAASVVAVSAPVEANAMGIDEGTVIAPSSFHMNKGDSKGVECSVDSNTNTWYLDWEVDNNDVSISGWDDETCNLYAAHVGTAVVTINLYSNQNELLDSDYFYVYVDKKADTDVQVEGIDVDNNQMTLKPGDSGKLHATIYPSNATNKAVDWHSSDNSIVQVDGDGVIKARKHGDATIYARAEATGDVATCKVHVTNGVVSVEGIAIDDHQVTIKAGETFNDNARVTPDEATNKGIAYGSSNTKVATVDKNGTITGIDDGTCTITYRSNEGNITTTCTVTVYGGETGKKKAAEQAAKEQAAKEAAAEAAAEKAAEEAAAQAAAQAAAAASGHSPTVQYGYLTKIANAAVGSTVILHASAPSAYDQNVINAINARPDLKVVAEFPFQGIEFHMYMPAGFSTAGMAKGGYVDWLTLCNYQSAGIQVTQVGAAHS